MPYALVNTTGDKDYHKAVIQFLEDIEHTHVSGVVMVAITDDGPYLSWDCSPIEMAAVASLVQSQATLNFQDGMYDDEEDGEDEDCDCE